MVNTPWDAQDAAQYVANGGRVSSQVKRFLDVPNKTIGQPDPSSETTENTKNSTENTKNSTENTKNSTENSTKTETSFDRHRGVRHSVDGGVSETTLAIAAIGLVVLFVGVSR
jgi:hypothetical protein